MIHFIYNPNWHAPLSVQDSLYDRRVVHPMPLARISQCPDFFSELAYYNADFTNYEKPELAQMLFERIMVTLHGEKLLGNFLSAMDQVQHQLGPFSVTQHFCLKLEDCGVSGEYCFNISPIYFLGLDYPEVYREQHGKELSSHAIIGLVERENQETVDIDSVARPTRFYYGIDAGEVFSEQKIPHNKKMCLYLQRLDHGLLLTLRCESQTTSKVLSWSDLGVKGGEGSGALSEHSHAMGLRLIAG